VIARRRAPLWAAGRDSFEAVPLAGSCRNGRRLLRFSVRLRAITWPSRYLDSVPARTIGSVTGHSATRPRLAHKSYRVERARWTAPTARPVLLTYYCGACLDAQF